MMALHSNKKTENTKEDYFMNGHVCIERGWTMAMRGCRRPYILSKEKKRERERNTEMERGESKVEIKRGERQKKKEGRGKNREKERDTGRDWEFRNNCNIKLDKQRERTN